MPPQLGSSGSEDDGDDVNAILFEELHVSSDHDPEESAKLCLRRETEYVTVGHTSERLVYGNLADQKTSIAILKSKCITHDKELAVHKEELAVHKDVVLSLQRKLHAVSACSDGFFSIRPRFIDTYKRDILHMEEFRGSSSIQKGNVVAHEGDAMGDAALFQQDHRTDMSIYRELYGMDYLQVLEINARGDDGGLFLALNSHATMIARGTPFPSHVATAFKILVLKVEENWLQKPNEYPNTPLGRAYYNFWRLLRETRKY